MTEKHRYSFFGKTILTVQSPSIKEPFIFLTCIRKKKDGQWEKPSQGEGRTVKCNIDEIAIIIQVLKSNMESWTTHHEFKEKKTKIFFGWEDQEKERWLRVQIGEYKKMLNLAHVELCKIILKHILKEKLIFVSSYVPIKSSNEQKNGLKVVEEVVELNEQEHLFEFDIDKKEQDDKEQKEYIVEDIEAPEISFDMTKGNYIKDIFYELEVERAVMYGRNKDDKVLWILKSAIKGGWNKDKKNPQLIILKYTPKNLGWVPRKI